MKDFLLNTGKKLLSLITGHPIIVIAVAVGALLYFGMKADAQRAQQVHEMETRQAERVARLEAAVNANRTELDSLNAHLKKAYINVGRKEAENELLRQKYEELYRQWNNAARIAPRRPEY